MSDTASQKTPKASRGWLREVISTVVYPLVIVVAIYALLVQPYRIPSGSMIDTLLIGDFVWVEKFAYGYSKHSIPFSPNLFSGRIWGAEPTRGDIAVFKIPTDNETDLIKRVIGLPGDHIQVTNGILSINGAPCPTQYVGDVDLKYYDADSGRMAETVGKKYRETLPGGVTHDIIKETDTGYANNTKEFVVPPGSYFMMGDNRDNSDDSRFWGPVPAENLVGKAVLVFPSFDGAQGQGWEFWKWPWSLRWDRFFHGLG